MQFIDNLEFLIRLKNTNKNRMLTDLKLSKNSIVDWKKRGNIPSGDVLSKIADYFGVSVEFLLNGKETEQKWRSMFYNKFLKLCEKNEIKPSVAANEIGFNKSTVSAWKRNGNNPNGDILFKVADYFNVSIEYLLTDKESTEKEKPLILNERFQKIIEKYPGFIDILISLSPGGVNKVLDYARLVMLDENNQ